MLILYSYLLKRERSDVSVSKKNIVVVAAVSDKYSHPACFASDTSGASVSTENVRVLVFIIFHSAKWVPNLWEFQQTGREEDEEMVWPPWIEYLSSLSHLLLTLNGSTTVFIYLFKHRAEQPWWRQTALYGQSLQLQITYS